MSQNFGKIAESIKICSTKAAQEHLVFDRYMSPSIKGKERQNRQNIPFNISGPQQNRPSDLLRNLKKLPIQRCLGTVFISPLEKC